MARHRRIASESEDEEFVVPRKQEKTPESEEDDEFEEEENNKRAAEKLTQPDNNDEDDEEEEITTSRRKTSVNYNEDDYFDEKLSEEVSEVDATPKKTVKLNYKRKRESDDESFHGDEVADEDIDGDPDADFSATDEETERRREERNFVVKDESDGDVDDELDDSDGPQRRTRGRPRKSMTNGSRFTRSRGRGRPRKTQKLEESETEEPSRDLTLAEELRELEDSPPKTPPHRKFNFRERKEVNYQLPPPILNDRQLEDVGSSYAGGNTPRRGRKPISGPLRRLFPTVGPFGGGDVTSIFGENIPGLTAVGGGDSDSSDDEILPLGGVSNRRNSLTAGTSGNFGKVEPKKKNSLADTDPLGIDTNIDFTAVGGLDNYIDQLKEMVALPLLYPEVYQRFGITPPRGVLFHGPPGTGKTLMARALAASCSTETNKITFFMRKGADILSKWVGEAERQLRLLFEEARKQQPSIIFFDEIDGLAPVRSSKQEQIHASIVSTMLALMDGMDNRGQVIVIGATNRPDSVDPALRRPGRFDREFYFPLPDISAREKILSIQTKKWNPPLDPAFVKKLADLTKGYCGADLRALCTESALNSIQRKYPQIYSSQEKLKITPEKINVVAKDFMKALEKIVPSSSRSVSSVSAPLPSHISPLLEKRLNEITAQLDKIIPRAKKVTALEEAMYVDFTENDLDGGFKRQELIKSLNNSRVFKPRVLISGPAGSGQVYLGRAILNHLEGFHVHSMDLSNLFNDSTRSIESAIIQMFVEAKRHVPSVIYIPNIDIWYNTIPDSAKSTLSGLLRSIEPNERMLLLCLAETEHHDLDEDLKSLFGFRNNLRLSNTFSEDQYEKFFHPLWTAFHLKPFEFGDLEMRPKRKLPKLKVLKKPSTAKSTGTLSKQEVKAQEKHDMRLKNTLKLKLSGLMEMFKNRYKRFKKPTIDDSLLVHLFDATALIPGIEPPYQRDGQMILEVATGKRFFNMDLDIIEERLWNGFYSEPKQFLRDIEMIYKDALVTSDRDRILRASEMFANAQVGVEEVSTPEFLAECRKMHARELERQKAFVDQRVSTVDPSETINNEVKALVERTTEINETPKEVNVEVTETTTYTNGDSEKKVDELDDVSMTEEQGSHDNVESKGSDSSLKQEAVQKPQEAKIEVEEQKKDEDDEEKEEEEDDDEEEEEYPEVAQEVLKKELIYDSLLLEKVKNKLVHNAAYKYTIENLEEINSQLMEIIWEQRLEWGRDAALKLMSNKVDEYQKYFESNL